jgi:tRNA pseudouridine32 synthase/23S rRNA pseudouridine746 synthase
MTITGKHGDTVVCVPAFKRQLSLSDLPSILDLQQIVMDTLPDKKWFAGVDEEYFRTLLSNPEYYSSGYFVRIPIESNKNEIKLVSFAFALCWKENTENYGFDLNLVPEDRLLTMNFEAFAVHPDWRGNGLQSLHIEECIKAAKKRGMKYGAATVAPNNTYSMKNFLDAGFREYCQKEKYGGFLRSILCIDLQPKVSFSEKYTSFTSPFPIEPAASICKMLMNHFDETGSICDNPKEEDESGFYSTAPLFKNNHGHMFGVLVCKKADSNEPVILKAFSGQYFGSWRVLGWVPPAMDVNAFDAEVLNTDHRIKGLTHQIEELERLPESPDGKETISKLKKERRQLTHDSLKRIYAMYSFYSIDGKLFTFGDSRPATGTGDCCAPKLLSYAYQHQLEPVSLAEFYYGMENRSGTKQHKMFYSPCRTKCPVVLPQIIGLDILYRDPYILVVNKAPDMLSVPGRGDEKQDCVVSRVKRLIPGCIEQPSVHRLDMETSGILVLALTQEAHSELSRQFRDGEVQKQYVALLRGSLFTSTGEKAREAVKKAEGQLNKGSLSGMIELPFRLDVDNRPWQVYDAEQGKWGTTLWQQLSEEKFQGTVVTRVLYTPITGRTHQLRLHSAHEKGLGLPIVGDTLYGKRTERENRMMLHARQITFHHPITKEEMNFYCPESF